MAILSDKEFVEAVRQASTLPAYSVWWHLNSIAEYLALLGDAEAAYDVWRYAFFEVDHVPSLCDDYRICGVSALCYHLQRADLYLGSPVSNLVDSNASLEERVNRFDDEARRTMTKDPWVPLVTNDAITLMRAGLARMTPHAEQEFSPAELDALPYFESFVAHPLSKHQPYVCLDALLLSADISSRHGQSSRADDYLHQWKNRAISRYAPHELVFAFPAVANLIFRGVLSNTSALTREERQGLVRAMLAPSSHAVLHPVEPPNPPTEIAIWPNYSTLSFEPSWNVDEEETWDLSPDELFTVLAPDEPYPVSVSTMTPWNTGTCVISIEYADAPPHWEEATHVYGFPIRTVPNPHAGDPEGVVGTLLPSTLPCGIGKEGFDVPPGEYDALARYYYTGGGNHGFDYLIVVSLMPRGTGRHGILKLDEFWLRKGGDASSDAVE